MSGQARRVVRADVSAYLVLGRENTCGRPVGQVVGDAVRAGFTCVQVRSKHVDARDLVSQLREAAASIEAEGAAGRVALLVDDRVDVACAALDAGVRVDGVHVGQGDVPVATCRRLLGPEAVVGLTLPEDDPVGFVRSADLSQVDYLGAAPVHPTATKPEAGHAAGSTPFAFDEGLLRQVVDATDLPVTVGGGVKACDLPMVARSGAAGFFVVSAVCGASDPYTAAEGLVAAWRSASDAAGSSASSPSAS